MAHYAYLDENNIVTQVIVGKDENDIVLDENGRSYVCELDSDNNGASIKYSNINN